MDHDGNFVFMSSSRTVKRLRRKVVLKRKRGEKMISIGEPSSSLTEPGLPCSAQPSKPCQKHVAADRHKGDRESTRTDQPQSGGLISESSHPQPLLNSISHGGLSVTPDWLPSGLVARLRADATALFAAGAFTVGALGGRSGQHGVEVLTRRCSCCGLFDDAAAARGVGDPRARAQLFEALADLRDALERHLGAPLAEAMELQYLRYPGGGEGFYGKHVDQQVRDPGRKSRVVSLLVYLNSPGWDSARDGGALRAWPQGCAAAAVEVEPAGGTLVLFDSMRLVHEARPTLKERWALVGWFLEGERRPTCAPSKKGTSGTVRSSGGVKKMKRSDKP